VDDGIAAGRRRAQARRVGDVSLHELDAPRRELCAAAAVADERAHGHVSRPQSVHDVRPDEARAAGDEDGQAFSFWKFCQ
jgi:hypothetical protein